jgi:uracil-DNA glycosylase
MSLTRLLRENGACRICSENLPFGSRPILQLVSIARLLIIIGQAPGSKVHESGIAMRGVCPNDEKNDQTSVLN